MASPGDLLAVEIDVERVARQFSRSAATYERHATVQNEMAQRLALTVEARALRPRDILEFGCGTGRLTALLRRTCPEARLTAVDVAEGMIAAASAKLNGSEGVRFVRADIETMPLEPEAHDLVVSNATIQWLARPEATFRRLAAALRPGGAMLHASFGPVTFTELYAAFAAVEREQRLDPRLHGLPLRGADEWTRTLRSAGLTEIECDSTRLRVDYPDCRALLRSIKRTGASYAPPLERTHARVLPEVMRRYDASYRGAEGVFATYEVLTLSATRP